MAFVNFGFLILILCLSSIALGQYTLKISYITPQQVRDIGEQVHLNCSYYADYQTWVKLKYDPHNTAEYRDLGAGCLNDSRFSMTHDRFSYTNTLKINTLSIKDIQGTDAGWYQCRIRNYVIKGDITAEVELIVRRPPIVFDNYTHSVVAREGETIQMECYAGGFPSPTISWSRNNSATLPTGGSVYRGNILKIASVHKEDRGTYYCVAENELGSCKRTINLEVESVPGGAASLAPSVGMLGAMFAVYIGYAVLRIAHTRH